MTSGEDRGLRGVPAARAAGPMGPPTSVDLWNELSAEWRTNVFAIHEPPFSGVIYNYDYVGQRNIDCRELSLGMQHELAWWLHSLHACGEGVSPIALTIWKNLIVGVNHERAQKGQPQVESFLELSFEAWMAGARRSYYERYGRLPGKSFSRNYEHILRRLHRALEIRYSTVEWWRHDLWDPKHDRRIPLGEHEALGGARVRFDTVPQPWLREGLKWFLAVGLERGEHKWTSITSYRVQLGTHFSRFLAEEGIDTPALCADPDMELRAVALRYLAFVRQLRTRRTGAPFSLATVGGLQAIVGRFYAFMADHRREAAELLGEPRWLELSDAHARFWRDGDMANRRRVAVRTGDYIEPDALSRIVEHLDIVGMPADEAKTVLVDDQPVAIAGLGDPQAMRAYLIAVFTGRRINEILMMDFDPIEAIPPLPGEPDDEHAFVARLRYQQTKIDGAPNTILIERAVVNIVREQQQWIREHGLRRLQTISQARVGGGPLAPDADPKYLFLMMQRNRLGQRPYSRETLASRLGALARALKIRDSQGRLVDFQRTHRLRHTKATDLLNKGVPVHVVQRYIGHRSPEMTMHYAATLPETHEREFLRLAKINRDGRPLGLDPRDVYEMVQLDKRTDRILPNGLCLLPPRQACNRGNACLTCDQFATDASYLPEHQQQLGKLVELIEQRQTLFEQRTGQSMSEDNVWLQGRRREQRALTKIITALQDPAAAERSVRGAGTSARHAEPDEPRGGE